MGRKMIRKLFHITCFLGLLVTSQHHAEEYLWAGANQYDLWYQDQKIISQQLNAMSDAGLKVLRIFLTQRGYQSWENPQPGYTFENPIGNYQDFNLLKVDYLMSECANRSIKMIISLCNHTEGNDVDDIYVKTFGPSGVYSQPAALQAAQNRITYFLNHTNIYLNKKWKDCNEVVYAWEIDNEAGIPLITISNLTVTEKHTIVRNYLTTLADHLKSVDPDTRVSLGIAGYAYYYNNGHSGDDIRTLGDIPSADIYTLHYYSSTDLERWINDNLPYCRSIGKLLFIEEFGNQRKAGMNKITSHYKYVAQTCRIKGIPWMFWRLGYLKGENDWTITPSDSIWQVVIQPEAGLINQVPTLDQWGVNSTTSIDVIHELPVSRFELTRYPNPFYQEIYFSGHSQLETLECSIWTINGIKIWEKSILSSPTGFQVRWDGFTDTGIKSGSGMYIFKISDLHHSEQIKFNLIK